MPTPVHSHTIGIIIKNLDSHVLEGAMITLSIGSESLTNQNTNYIVEDY